MPMRDRNRIKLFSNGDSVVSNSNYQFLGYWGLLYEFYSNLNESNENCLENDRIRIEIFLFVSVSDVYQKNNSSFHYNFKYHQNKNIKDIEIGNSNWNQTSSCT
jgi:hypothetical protein